MKRLLIITDLGMPNTSIKNEISHAFDVRFLALGQIEGITPSHHVVFDINLQSGGTRLLAVKKWLKRKPKGAKVIFVVNKASRLERIQSYALGATDVVHRPITGKALLATLTASFDALAFDPSQPSLTNLPAVGPALNALEDLFSSALLGEPFDLQNVEFAGSALIDRIEENGLGYWIETIRRHHSLTYQHSLIVTGVAVAFGQNIGLSKRDQHRLSFAGMLHDIGKARIPISILEKPGPLTPEEMETVRKHPEYGLEALKSAPVVSNEMVDMVVHHHEYLDGTGYPHGLSANEISDLVRIITISDIFGALIERRSYREPMSSSDAYEILVSMGPKLDRDLVRAFKFASRLSFNPPSPYESQSAVCPH